MIAQILANTPKWVFGLFFVLLWLGAKQLLRNQVSLTRMTVMPIAMTGLSLYGVASAFGDSPMALLTWAAGAAAAALVVLSRPVPTGTRYDAASRSFSQAGSAVPLALMMGIFFTKYAVGVTLAMHPALAHDTAFALGLGLLYGAFSGTFTGRAIRLWRLAIRQDAEAGTATAPAVSA